MRCASSGRVGDSERVISGAVSLSSAGRVPGRHRIRNPAAAASIALVVRSIQTDPVALGPSCSSVFGRPVLLRHTRTKTRGRTVSRKWRSDADTCAPSEHENAATTNHPRSTLLGNPATKPQSPGTRSANSATPSTHAKPNSRRPRPPSTSREGTRARASPRELDQRRQRPPPSRTRRRRTQPSRPAGTTRRTPPHPVEPAASAGPSPGPTARSADRQDANGVDRRDHNDSPDHTLHHAHDYAA